MFITIGLILANAVIIFFLRQAKLTRLHSMKTIISGFLALNILILAAVATVLLTDTPLKAQGNQEQNQAAGQTQSTNSSANLGAAIAVGLATIGAGIAVGVTGAAAIGGITQKPEVFGRSLVFVGLAEGIAIYGLIISFMILTR